MNSSQQLARTEEDADLIVGCREQLWHLLAEAAEIEHTLMCTYLYAAFSLKRPGHHGLTKHQSGLIEGWRKSVLEVATQEMTHLLLVSNLMVAVGGRPHFSRPNFPVSRGYFPSDVVAQLAPFSKDTIDHFVFLERPPGEQDEDGAGFEDKEYTREQVERGLMPSAQDYATIGHLYEGIRANLRYLERTLGSGKLFTGSQTAQLVTDVVGLPDVAPITTLADAERAIDLIIEQGEGASADRETSHYRTYCSIRDELAFALQQDPQFAPAWPAAHNPVLRRPPDPSEKVWITAQPAARLLDFGCAIYGLLLRLLVQCFARPFAGNRSDQQVLFDAAMAMMHALAEVGSELVKLPASQKAPHVNAGFTFTMLRGVDPLLFGKPEALYFQERLTEVSDAARDLQLRSSKTLGVLARDFQLFGEKI